jgi:hypothetical protein
VKFPIRGSPGFSLDWISTNTNASRAAVVVPNTLILLAAGEGIIALNGSSDGSRLLSLSLKTTQNRILGPYGNPDSGTGWIFIGRIYSFWGGVTTGGGLVTLGPLGFYADAPAPPPLPPARPPPPPSPPPGPASPPQWNLGRVQSYTYGWTNNYYWDDGGTYSGVPRRPVARHGLT